MTDIQTYANIDELRLVLGENDGIPAPYVFESGKIPEKALYQGFWWRDRTGKLYKIKNMHPIHAQRALRKLWGAYHERCGVFIEMLPLWEALSVRANSSGY